MGWHGPRPARLRQADRAPVGATRLSQPDLDALVAFALAADGQHLDPANLDAAVDVDAAAGLSVASL